MRPDDFADDQQIQDGDDDEWNEGINEGVEPWPRLRDDELVLGFRVTFAYVRQLVCVDVRITDAIFVRDIDVIRHASV